MTRIPDNFNATPDLLKGKTVLVTGATGGFGKPLALALAQHGATVILLARNLRMVEALYDEIDLAGYPKPAIYPMNLEGASEHDYGELASNIESQLGQLDGLIHCAAILGALCPERCGNLVPGAPGEPACALSTDPRLPAPDEPLRARFDTVHDRRQDRGLLGQLLAQEYAGSNLRVNCFNPGKTRTGLQLRAYPAADENERLPSPQDHIDTFLYLMSDTSNENGEIFTA
jgi:NAD(P)-dependent dehydrogenase (short-subunit alcohol dehydrogenase family)